MSSDTLNENKTLQPDTTTMNTQDITTPTTTITLLRDRGTQFRFTNGITVSVMCGERHYCNGRRTEHNGDLVSAEDAEVAVWGRDGRLMHTAYRTADEVAQIMEWARALPMV